MIELSTYSQKEKKVAKKRKTIITINCQLFLGRDKEGRSKR